MDGLFWNKVAFAVLAAGLILFGLREAAHVIYHPHELEEPAYVIDIPDPGGVGPVVVEGPVDFGLLLASANVSAGETVAKKCVSCHSFNEGGATMTGPNLWNIVGKTAGAKEGYKYSNAMAAFGEPWDYAHLYEYLENPRAYVPGTAMSFAGLRKQEDRINIIAYLRSLSSSPVAIPEPLAAAPAPDAIAAPEGLTIPDASDATNALDAITDPLPSPETIVPAPNEGVPG